MVLTKKHILVKRLGVLFVVLGIVLTSCAGTLGSGVALPATVDPSAMALTDTQPALPTPAASSTPTGVVTVEPAPASTGSAATLAPTSSPASTNTGASPWPRSLLEINLGIPAGNSYNPKGMAVDPGLNRLYVRTHIPLPNYRGQGVVAVLDLETGKVLSVVETGPDDYSDGQLAVDPGQHRLYVVNPGDETCSVLDAQTMQPITTLQDVDQFALDSQGGLLYVVGSGGLRVLDTATYDVVQEVPIASGSQVRSLAVDAANGRVYAIYSANSGYVLAIYRTTDLETVATVSLPGPTDSLLPDPNRSRLYLTLNDGVHSLLWTLDGQGNVLEQEQLGDWLRHTPLSLDSTGNQLFLGRDLYGDYGITVRDLQTGQDTADVALDASPNTLAWDSENGRLLVGQTYLDRIIAVDVKTGQSCSVADSCITGTFPTAINLDDVAVDPSRNRLYVTDTVGWLHVLDSSTGEELARLPGAGRISVDGPHDRVYTGGDGASTVRVFDADRLEQTAEIESQAIPVADPYDGGLFLVHNGIYIADPQTLAITGVISGTVPATNGFSPNPTAVDAVVDPGSGRLFAIINNGIPGSNNGNSLYVYEPPTYDRVFTDGERSVTYVDVDPNTGWAYVSRIYMASGSTSLLEDGRNYTARLDGVFGALRVDPDLGRVYLSDAGDTQSYLLVLDAANLDVLGSVSIPQGFTLRAVDPLRHTLFLATREGKIELWSATGGELPAATQPVPAQLPVDEVGQLFLSPDGQTLFAGSLYQSDDGGQSWLDISAGLPALGIQQVVVSPDFNQDHTLFAVPVATDEGLGIWKSTDGGQSWRMANDGLSDLAVTGLAISPAFADDGTLFATTRHQGLFRSTDGGASWEALTGRYQPQGATTDQAGVLALSPTYGQDHTLFIAQYGLQRSTDGGETWTQVQAQEPSSLALSPAFSDDGTLFGWFGAAGLLCSTDDGQTWSAASAGLTLAGFGTGRVILAPDYDSSQTVYFIWTPSSSGTPVQFFRSVDGAQSWQQLNGTPPQGLAPVQLSPDGSAFLTLDDSGRLVQYPVDGLPWQPVTLPPIGQIAFDGLILSPDFGQDRTLMGVSEGAGILQSGDAGLTWANTGFPLRVTSGDAPRPVILPSGDLLVGTVLGLYRLHSDGSWTPVGGGLPSGIPASNPTLGSDGALRVVVGSGETGKVYVSTDGGTTWTVAIESLPAGATASDLLLSPALATDRTAFYAPSYGKPQRTLDGSTWEEFGPPGDWQWTTMQISPTFGRDGLLIARLDDNSLWRSVDRGDTWTQIDGPWTGGAPYAVTPSDDYRLRAVTFSPTFGRDGTLFTLASDAVYRSPDRGATWTKVLDLKTGLSQAAFSPGYAQDGTMYLLQGVTLYRSTDRGQTWKAMPAAPWNASDEIHLAISPTFRSDRFLCVWTLSGRVYESTDGGQSWQETSNGLAGQNIRQVVLSPSHATDGLIFLVPYGTGLFKQVSGGAWLPVTESAPSPAPVPTPTPTGCAIQPDRFQEVWQAARTRLGCPEEQANQIAFVEQPFEHGRMFWDSSTLKIYVLMDNGTWSVFDDTFDENTDPAYDPNLPPPPKQPQRGFGKVWREQLGGPKAAIGWATANEEPVDAWREQFQGGLLIWSDATQPGGAESGIAYVLYDDGTWQAFPTLQPTAPSPQPTPTQAPVTPPKPTPTQTPTPPAAVPTPVVCAIRPVKFQSVWQQLGVRLGCPQEQAAQIPFAEQLFEHGRMFWDSSTLKIYVLMDSGTWSVFDDTFDENTDPAYDPSLPPPPKQPQRGFGKVWREQLGGSQAAIGWAVDNEKSVAAWRQSFEGGLLIWSNVDQTSGAGWGTAYLLYHDGTWQPVAAAQP